MPPANRNDSQTFSTKLPAELAEKLDRMAYYRGVSRSWLLRELAEAAVDGRVTLPLPSRGGLTISELAASDVGRAARQKAQLDAAAACSDRRAAGDVAAAAPDLDAIAREMAAGVARGR